MNDNELNVRLRTKKQREASRRNGAKSGGRNSKARAERLAKVAESYELRTEQLTRAAVLPGEAADRFAAFARSLREQLQPSSEVEAALIDTITIARWRQMRSACMLQQVTAAEMGQQQGPAPNRYYAALQRSGEALGELRKAEKDHHKEFVATLRMFLQWRKGKLRAGPEPEIPLTASSETWAAEEEFEDEVLGEEVLDE